jgi:nucleotide-binding universal stress UspA family protein
MAESIVVGTDGSERADRAVDEAVRLAKALGAELHVVSAYEPLRGAKIAGAPEGAAAVWAPLPDSTVESTLSQTAASARLQGNLEVVTHAVRKDPAEALLSVAAEIGADLIVVGNHGMHGAKRLLGSVPNAISHKARCNVLIVSTEAG